MGFNERKLTVLKIIRDRNGATPRKITELLNLKRGTINKLLKRYEFLGYISSVRYLEKNPVNQKPRRGPRTKLYNIVDKGRRWLIEAEALVAHGHQPRPGRYKVT